MILFTNTQSVYSVGTVVKESVQKEDRKIQKKIDRIQKKIAKRKGKLVGDIFLILGISLIIGGLIFLNKASGASCLINAIQYLILGSSLLSLGGTFLMIPLIIYLNYVIKERKNKKDQSKH